MANPLSVAALAAFPLVSNLQTLPTAQAKGLGSVGTTLVQYYDDNVAPITIRSGASGVSASGTVSFFLICSEDGTNWTNGINPNATTDQSLALAGLTPLQPILPVVANATNYIFPEFSVYSILGFMPSYWALVAFNQSGAALDATLANFYARHSLVSYV
jgi:hypothetical protein